MTLRSDSHLAEPLQRNVTFTTAPGEREQNDHTREGGVHTAPPAFASSTERRGTAQHHRDGEKL